MGLFYTRPRQIYTVHTVNIMYKLQMQELQKDIEINITFYFN